METQQEAEARRYRWFRDNANGYSPDDGEGLGVRVFYAGGFEVASGETLDEAIDAAIAQQALELAVEA